MSYRDNNRTYELLILIVLLISILLLIVSFVQGISRTETAEDQLGLTTTQVEQPAVRETNTVLEIYSNTYGDRLMCMEGYGEVRVYQNGNQAVYDTPAGKVVVSLMPIVNRPAKECEW